MKKKYSLFLAFCASLLTGCNSCAKDTSGVDSSFSDSSVINAVDASEDSSEVISDGEICIDEASTFNIIKLDNWELTLPSSWKVETSGLTDPSLKLKATSVNSLVSLTVEPFTENNLTYMLLVTRGIKKSGGQLTGTKAVEINDLRVFNLSVVNKSTNIWMWTTVANKNGYILSCGTSVADAGVADASVDTVSEKACSDIAQTFKIH